MKKRTSQLGSALVSLLLALFLVVLAVSTVWIILRRIWWMPESISTFGGPLDAQFGYTFFIVGLVFFFAQLGLAFVVLRYRDRGGKAHYSHGNNTLEILWTAATAILFIGLGIWAERSWASVHFVGPAPGAVPVEVTGKQFAWNFRYPGPDGQFGRTAPELVNDAGGNPLGLDSSDPAAQDDIVTPVMAVPAHRQVEVILRTKDVTHSFFVRELRFKQDTVPGMVIRLHFTAEQTGRYEIVCTELCGLGHHRMRSFLEVLPEAEFQNWLREQAALAALE